MAQSGGFPERLDQNMLGFVRETARRAGDLASAYLTDRLLSAVRSGVYGTHGRSAHVRVRKVEARGFGVDARATSVIVMERGTGA